MSGSKETHVLGQVFTLELRSELLSINQSCQICMDDELKIDELVQYTFNSRDWYMTSICEECCNYFGQSKFENWKHLIENTDCEATFARMLKVGLVTKIYDPVMFPSPKDEIEMYQVIDKNGKLIDIPREVQGLRIPDENITPNPKIDDETGIENIIFRRINCHLNGAPNTWDDQEDLWKQMIEGFKDRFGIDYINKFLETPQGPDPSEFDDNNLNPNNNIGHIAKQDTTDFFIDAEINGTNNNNNNINNNNENENPNITEKIQLNPVISESDSQNNKKININTNNNNNTKTKVSSHSPHQSLEDDEDNNGNPNVSEDDEPIEETGRKTRNSNDSCCVIL